MSKGKKPPAAEVPVAPPPSWTAHLKHPLARRAMVVGVVALTGGALLSAGWQHFGPAITNSQEYRLDEARIELTPQPGYIHANVKADTVRMAGLNQLSILDPKLTEKVQHAFALHTWVASVQRVSKHHPARVVVDVEYRRPAAMVEVTTSGERGLLPVDAYGVLLPPEDFSMNQVKNYLRISIGSTQPEGPVGTPWGDQRVASAAGVAAVLTEHWQKWQLYRIVVATPQAGDLPGAPAFDVLTRDGARVIWGHAPGQEASGEASTGEKLAQLSAHFDKHGPLSHTGDHREINVRDGHVKTTPATSASFKK